MRTGPNGPLFGKQVALFSIDKNTRGFLSGFHSGDPYASSLSASNYDDDTASAIYPLSSYFVVVVAPSKTALTCSTLRPFA